jgi:hypothetical protein
MVRLKCRFHYRLTTCKTTISKRKDANLSQPWKVSEKLCFAMLIKLENNGRMIGIDLAADHIAHFLIPQIVRFRDHLGIDEAVSDQRGAGDRNWHSGFDLVHLIRNKCPEIAITAVVEDRPGLDTQGF